MGSRVRAGSAAGLEAGTTRSVRSRLLRDPGGGPRSFSVAAPSVGERSWAGARRGIQPTASEYPAGAARDAAPLPRCHDTARLGSARLC